MLQLDPAALLRRLNSFCTQALEGAAGVCLSRGHYEITIAHCLSQLISNPNGDIYLVLRHFDIDSSRLEAALTRQLEAERSGNSGRPVFSPHLFTWMRDAWLLSSIELKQPVIRSGALLTVLVLDPYAYPGGAWTDTLAEISGEELQKALLSITAGSTESDSPGATGDAAGAAPAGAHSRSSETALGKFTNDFTAQARTGDLDPVIGRESEIRQCIDILARRRKNNPIIVGEAGVGKTALVEGLAQRIVAGEVPSPLVDVDLLGLDLGLLQAGASVKGEFENRLKSVIEEVKSSPKPIILFIDEAHTMIGAGGSVGGSDAANLLKPALARGELRTLAATTWSEYKKYFEKDPALTRRFQLVKVEEPSEQNAIAMMRGLAPEYERSHGIRIPDDAVVAAVELSARYISGRQLPDKAADLMDTCAARVNIGHDTKPPVLSDLERRIEILQREQAALSREKSEGMTINDAQLAAVEEEISTADKQRAELQQRWETQRDVVHEIVELRRRVRAAEQPAGETPTAELIAETPDGDKPADKEPARQAAPAEQEQGPAGEQETSETPAELRTKLDELQRQLEQLQQQEVLIPLDVRPNLVADVVSDWTGIPAGKMVQDQAELLLNLEDKLEERIRGQKRALKAIAEGIRGSKLGLANPRAPIGVFLLVGPSGVGKTETGLALAELLFGGERFLVTINMSEFQEKHTVSRLIGSPPGYVGYGEGGRLTEAVRQRPYSSVILDEVEKANPEVMNLFYQVFDKGMLADGEGRDIDFRNTVLLLTSNLASDVMTEMCMKPGTTHQQVFDAIRPILSKHFKPALLARMTIVPYMPLSGSAMRQIVDLKLGHLRDRIKDTHRIEMSIDDVVAEQIVMRCSEVETGARNIDHIMSSTLLPMISRALLDRMAQQTLPERMTLGFVDGDYALSFDVEG